MLLLADPGLGEAVVMIVLLASALVPLAVIGWGVFFYWFIRNRQRAAYKRRFGDRR